MREKGFATNDVQMLYRNFKDRLSVFEHYGGFVCACCKETEPSFLSIDHIGGGGGTERMRIFRKKYQGGHHFYRWLRVNGYPPGYQVLCMNCQQGKRDNGGHCPHERPAPTIAEMLDEFEKLRVGSSCGSKITSTEGYQVSLARVRRKISTLA
jgi:hypothetical protein